MEKLKKYYSRTKAEESRYGIFRQRGLTECIHFLMFENASNICWLNATMSIIAHNPTINRLTNIYPECQLSKILEKYYEAMFFLNDFENESLNISERLERTARILADIQESTLYVLQPKMRYKIGEPDSAFCCLLNLLKLNKNIEKYFQITYNLVRECQNCGSVLVSEQLRKSILTLPKVDTFDPLNPVSLCQCPDCKSSDQKLKVVYTTLPSCVIFHFENGIIDGREAPLRFEVNKRQYDLIAVMTLEVGEASAINHFVSFIRYPGEIDPETETKDKWLECNDLIPVLAKFFEKIPDMDSKSIYMYVYQSLDKNLDGITVEKDTVKDPSLQTTKKNIVCIDITDDKFDAEMPSNKISDKEANKAEINYKNAKTDLSNLQEKYANFTLSKSISTSSKIIKDKLEFSKNVPKGCFDREPVFENTAHGLETDYSMKRLETNVSDFGNELNSKSGNKFMHISMERSDEKDIDSSSSKKANNNKRSAMSSFIKASGKYSEMEDNSQNMFKADSSNDKEVPVTGNKTSNLQHKTNSFKSSLKKNLKTSSSDQLIQVHSPNNKKTQVPHALGLNIKYKCADVCRQNPLNAGDTPESEALNNSKYLKELDIKSSENSAFTDRKEKANESKFLAFSQKKIKDLLNSKVDETEKERVEKEMLHCNGKSDNEIGISSGTLLSTNNTRKSSSVEDALNTPVKGKRSHKIRQKKVGKHSNSCLESAEEESEYDRVLHKVESTDETVHGLEASLAKNNAMKDTLVQDNQSISIQEKGSNGCRSHEGLLKGASTHFTTKNTHISNYSKMQVQKNILETVNLHLPCSSKSECSDIQNVIVSLKTVETAKSDSMSFQHKERADKSTSRKRIASRKCEPKKEVSISFQNNLLVTEPKTKKVNNSVSSSSLTKRKHELDNKVNFSSQYDISVKEPKTKKLNSSLSNLVSDVSDSVKSISSCTNKVSSKSGDKCEEQEQIRNRIALITENKIITYLCHNNPKFKRP